MRQLSGAEQVTEPGNGRVPAVFVNPTGVVVTGRPLSMGTILAQRTPGCEANVRAGSKIISRVRVSAASPCATVSSCPVRSTRP